MFRHYFKAASRFLRKNRIFAGINILGLSIALAASFIILLFVINEISFNHCHQNRKRVFRVLNYYKDFDLTMAGTPYVLSKTLKEDFPQVEKTSNTRYVRGLQLKLGEDFIRVQNPIATDSEIFEIFTIPLMGGTSNQNLLDHMNSIVLSSEMAGKFFPDEDPLGKEIEGLVNDSLVVFTVNGVFEDMPTNSTFKAGCFINGKWTLEPLNRTFGISNADVNWTMNFYSTWILLPNESDARLLEEQMRDFEIKHISEDPVYNFSFQRLPDVYLKSEEVQNTGLKGNMKNIRLFSSIAFMIVLIAAINYIILSIAVSTGRVKEIGIRKTAGASVLRIRNQLLSESLLLAMLVLPLSLLLMWLGKPYAEELFQTELQIISSNVIIYIFVYLFLTVAIGITSGIYASSYLSRLKVLDILKNTIHFGKRRKFFRSFLIVIQLVIFCSFVSGTLVIRSQYRYAISHDPGHFTKDVLLIDLGRNFRGYSAFMEGIKSSPDVISEAGAMDGLPMQGSMSYMLPHFQDEELKVNVEGLAIDYNFLETMGLSLLEGRDYSEEFGSDLEHAVILNETAVEQLGIQDPVGKELQEGRIIIGVVQDFNLHSIHSNIPPLDISLTDRYIHQLVVHYKPGRLESVLKMVKAQWKKAEPDRPFSYSTIEEIIESLYTSEKNLSSILSIAALFALLIAAFGLFGLTLFVARSRTNEIGIKKVFGSSEKSIVYSFLRNNLILIVIAWLLSIPVTLYFITKWLNNYPFRVDVEWWIFAIAFIIATIVVLLTVFIHSFKASRINPVEALRYE